MRARLFARFGPEQGIETEFREEATIGRGKDNTVMLSSREVSQRHARIAFDAESGAYWLEDLGSLNGTKVDGQAVRGRRRLGGLHLLSFGASAELFFLELDAEASAETVGVEPLPRDTQVDAEAPTLPPTFAAAAEREGTRVDDDAPTLPVGLEAAGRRAATSVERLPADLPPNLAGGDQPADAGDGEPAVAPPRLFLEVVDAPGGRYELQPGDNLIGRSGRARIVLAHRELSRRHATLRLADGRVWLRDEGSRNHTYVDDERLTEEVEIEPGTEVRFGRLRARLTVEGTAGGGGEVEEEAG